MTFGIGSARDPVRAAFSSVHRKMCRRGWAFTYPAVSFTTHHLPHTMRTHLFICLLAAGLTQNAMAIEVSHTVTGDKAGDAKPMAWRYRMLAAGQDLFDKRAPSMAPGATLSFSLPKVEGGDNQVQIVKADGAVKLPMVTPTSFRLVRDDEAAQENADVVVNRRFAPGEMIHPNVQVRSPGVGADTRRLGDLRLACQVQVAMVKTEEMKLRMLVAVVSMFGVDLCEKLKVDEIDAPRGFARVAFEYAGHRVVYDRKGTAEQAMPTLSDRAWPDDTRISYLNDGAVN
jgi:hypothetical protein